MKIKKTLLSAIAISIMTIIGSSQIINANMNVEETIAPTMSEKYDCYEPCGKCPGPGKMMGKNIFKDSVDELQKSGVLNSEDVKNIEAYHKKLREQRKEEMKKKREAVIDNMVNEKVISADKGEKLKATIEKNIENEVKNIEDKN